MVLVSLKAKYAPGVCKLTCQKNNGRFKSDEAKQKIRE